MTTAVEKRIRKRARQEIPPGKPEQIVEVVYKLAFWIGYPSAYFITKALVPDSGYFVWAILLGGPLIGAILIVVANLLTAKPRKERKVKIERRVLELAEIRKKAYEEALRFYSSPEWIEVRKRVIKEEGRICAECGKKIKNDADVTVDHKFPRSKYRDKELDRDNLRVLCRRCNSSKGAKEFDW